MLGQIQQHDAGRSFTLDGARLVAELMGISLAEVCRGTPDACHHRSN
jgi:hypothetical protein